MRQMNEGILMKHKWREWGENKDYWGKGMPMYIGYVSVLV